MLENLLAELVSGDDERAEKSISPIVELEADAIPVLLDLTRATEVDSRWWAVRALAASPHTRTEDLIPLLNDSAPEVRAAAALAICNHPHENAIDALIKALGDEDTLTASLAGNALVKIGSPSVPSLIEVTKASVEPGRNEASIGVQILALRALAEIRDHRAIPIMMKLIQQESSLLQYWAQAGLEKLGLDMVYIKP